MTALEWASATPPWERRLFVRRRWITQVTFLTSVARKNRLLQATANEFRFQARPLTLGKPDKQLVLIRISNHKRRRPPTRDGCLDALLAQMPAEGSDLIVLQPDKYTAVAARPIVRSSV